MESNLLSSGQMLTDWLNISTCIFVFVSAAAVFIGKFIYKINIFDLNLCGSGALEILTESCQGIGYGRIAGVDEVWHIDFLHLGAIIEDAVHSR